MTDDEALALTPRHLRRLLVRQERERIARVLFGRTDRCCVCGSSPILVGDRATLDCYCEVRDGSGERDEADIGPDGRVGAAA